MQVVNAFICRSPNQSVFTIGLLGNPLLLCGAVLEIALLLLVQVLAIFLIGTVGLLARNYFGRKIIEWVDSALMRIPLLNKIYSATKQVNDAFSSTNKTAFRTVVLVEFPHPGVYSIGFITSDQQAEVQAKTGQKMVCVFVPATPNPTSGFLLMVPEDKVLKLGMSVPDAIKYIISLGPSCRTTRRRRALRRTGRRRMEAGCRVLR